ncbi:FAD-binding oxidoreductase [Nocardia sp. 2]|uniref:FAD-binding oxidoreductase n=1 Tax=Nocardia acididurans TaxID=2802282 RepID=A0ABS1LZG1_9NOCA|nr:FAD-binding oxidoreductase [Nocardia acididurans]MBL1073646.1 FAD-binding oxidoreductase [Nocardia acididurans]
MSTVVIVGGGITGLLTAVHCARDGHRVTVVERGPLPNPESSSFDQHRVLRAPAPGSGPELHQHWLRLQTLLGGRFYRRVGVVTGWPADRIGAAVRAARQAGVRLRVEAPDTLPHIVFPAGYVGVRELDAGVLLADRVLRAAVRWLRNQPGVMLRSGCEVSGVDTAAARVVLADGKVLAGDTVLVAAGIHTRELVPVPTVLYRQTVAYVHPPADLRTWWEHAPSVGAAGTDGRRWLVPPGDGTLLKLSSSALCRVVGTPHESTEPDRAAAHDCRESVLAQPHRYPIAALKHCHYTTDPRTGAGALDQLGPAVWARAATGGDGFRTAPLIAERIAAVVRPGLAA